MDFVGRVSDASSPAYVVAPLRISRRFGLRPILAAGNANGDIPMLDYCARGAGPKLCLLVHHDDGEREYAYSGGAEEALMRAARDGWTVVSMASEWRTVFGPQRHDQAIAAD